MGKIITITNQKGGVGKTTTAHALATGLSIKGYKTLAIDLDPQCNLSFTFGADIDRLPSMYDVMKGDTPIIDAIQETETGYIIPSSLELAGADMEFTQPGREYILKEAIDPIKNNYDYIVIDTPPTLSIITINALTASYSVVIPMQANIYSLQGLGRLYDTIEAIKKYCNKSLKISGVLLTRYNNRTVISKDLSDIIETKSNELNTRVYKTKIREGVAIQEAQAMQKNIYKGHKNNPAEDYMYFIEEFLKTI